jgi:hypothetical protein
MKTVLLLTIGALFLSSPADARRYYYNPSFPNQPGSYNDHVNSSFRTALHSVAVTTVRDPGGNTWSGSPNGGAPGAKVVEGEKKVVKGEKKVVKGKQARKPRYRKLTKIKSSQLKQFVAKKLRVDPMRLSFQTSEIKIRRPNSIFARARRIKYQVTRSRSATTRSGKLTLVRMKNRRGSRLFRHR